MKRILLSFMALIIASVGLSAQSQIFNVGGFYYRLMPDTNGGNESDLIAVVSTIGDADYYKGEISIPSTISLGGVQYSVAAIGDLAFKGSKQLTSIRIPASIRQVPAGAFYGCDNLVSITVDSDNPVYDSRDNCNAVIETATNTLVAGCKNTVIPSSVPILGECAFYGTRGLTSLTVTESIKEIGNWTFLDCENIETLNWNSVYPPSLVTNYSKLFLRDVVLGDSVTYIESWAFSGCRNLKSIKYSSNIKGIGNYAFAYCESLTSMIIPYGVENMGYDAFIGCDGIETLYLNSNNAKRAALRSLGPSLKTLVLGDSVTSLDLWDFAQCDELESIVVEPGNPVFDSRSNCNAIIETATNKLLVGCKTTTIPEGVTCIESGAFSYCGGPKTISLPSSLLSIANHAFLGCDSLTSLAIPANVNKIGLGITNGCYSLTSLSVDPKNAYYDSRGDCNAIIEKSSGKLIAGSNRSTVPDGVTEIETNAFSDLHGLSSIIIPSSVKSIGSSAFSGCVGLKTITLPSSLDNIGSFAFQQCINLLSVKIPQGIKSIGTGLFYGCDTLTTVEIPSNVDSIRSRAFMYCRSLKSLIIPEGVTTIEDLAFAGCYSLSYLSMPSTVTKIDGDVFYGCESLKTTGPKGGGYNYEFSWDTIPANAFMGLKNLESVVIPKTVKAVYECDNRNAYWGYDDGYPSSVFAGCYNLKSVSVSFKDTKLFRLYIRPLTGTELFEESAMDYNLYKTNPVRSITVLDDSVKTFSTILTGSVENLVLSENVVYIDSSAFSFTPYIIYRANSYDDVYIENNIQDISVESGNRHFMSIDGVLFNKDGNQLVAYPGGRMGGYRIPASTTTIASRAFSNCYELTDVYIPNSVTQISDRAFAECERLSEVIIEGAPVVGLYAFDGCRNIQSVRTRSAVPGLMELSDSPQTIMAGERNRLDCEGSINSVFNAELGRTVSLMKGYGASEWGIRIDAFNIPSGSYKVSVGILPSPDNMLSEFHPIISGIKQSGERVTLLDSIEELDYPPFEDYKYYMNDGNVITTRDSVMYRPGKYRVVTKIVPVGYDSVLIADSLVIPEGIEYLQINMEMISADYSETSSYLFLDRIFFEPLDSDMPVLRYAGTFTENVFNDATLYVPEGAVETYRTADGWKYFKHIEVDTKTYPADEIEVSVNEAGYATFYYSDGAYTLPQGLSAMVVSGIADDKLVYETIAYGSESDIIPAGVPVILVSDNKKAGSFKLRLSDSSFEYMGDNLLYGSDTECLTYSFGNSYFYKLSYGPSGTDLSGVPGWYWGAPNGGAFNIEAHKAWLAVPARFGTKAAVGFSMSGDDVTEALSVKADGDDTEPVYYDLNGRNLYAPLGGTISISNGTKVIIIDK